MVLACIVCMILANVATGVCLCFTKKDGWGFYATKTLSLISLICFGISVAVYKSNFSGFTLLLILSVVAMFLSILNVQSKKLEDINQDDADKDVQNVENLPNNDKNSRKKYKKSLNFEKIAQILPKLAYVLSSLCIAFSALYIGKETPFGMLLGVSLAFAMTFLDFIIRKVKKADIWQELKNKFLIYIAAGLALGSIIPVLLYSFAITNIIFCVGLVVYACYFILLSAWQNKLNYLAYILGTIIMFAAILF